MQNMSIKDVARPGSRWSKAAIRQIVERFKLIKRRNGGRLTAALVLEDARGELSPLHRYFEWDDAKASERWRLEQARKLIQQHYVVVRMPGAAPSKPTRAHVIVKLPNAGRGYIGVVDAMRDDEFSEQVVSRARDEMKAWVARYERFHELRAVVALARRALRRLG